MLTYSHMWTLTRIAMCSHVWTVMYSHWHTPNPTRPGIIYQKKRPCCASFSWIRIEVNEFVIRLQWLGTVAWLNLATWTSWQFLEKQTSQTWFPSMPLPWFTAGGNLSPSYLYCLVGFDQIWQRCIKTVPPTSPHRCTHPPIHSCIAITLDFCLFSKRSSCALFFFFFFFLFFFFKAWSFVPLSWLLTFRVWIHFEYEDTKRITCLPSQSSRRLHQHGRHWVLYKNGDHQGSLFNQNHADQL